MPTNSRTQVWPTGICKSVKKFNFGRIVLLTNGVGAIVYHKHKNEPCSKPHTLHKI